MKIFFSNILDMKKELFFKFKDEIKNYIKLNLLPFVLLLWLMENIWHVQQTWKWTPTVLRLKLKDKGDPPTYFFVSCENLMAKPRTRKKKNHIRINESIIKEKKKKKPRIKGHKHIYIFPLKKNGINTFMWKHA